MSDVRTDLEFALIEALKGADGLSTVKTWENSIRDCLFTGEAFTQGFRAEELPAIAVSCQLKPSKRSLFTPGERQYEIPVSITILTRAARSKDAIAAAAQIQDAMDPALDGLRRSGNALGRNTIIQGEISSSATSIDEKPAAFAISTTEFTVLKVVPI